MNHLPKTFLFALSVLLILLTFFASVFFFSKKSIIPPNPSTSLRASPQLSVSPALSPTPTINWQAVHVPEPGETATDSATAVPISVLPAAFGSKSQIRVFDISAQKDALSVQKIIVYQGDILDITFSAIGGDYDLTFPSFGISAKAQAGETSVANFSPPSSGSFDFYCQSCQKAKVSRFQSDATRGILLAKPLP